MLIFIICNSCFYQITWVKPLKDKKDETDLNAFIEIIHESNRKPNKLWFDQPSEFYNKLMQECLTRMIL